MAQHTRGTGRRIDGQGSNWIRKGLRFAVYARDGFRCVYCGCRVSTGARGSATLDHVTPHAHGGTNATSNLVTACRACNAAKGERTAAEWCDAGQLDAVDAALEGRIDRARGAQLAEERAHELTPSRATRRRGRAGGQVAVAGW